jgi:hypothetical protein
MSSLTEDEGRYKLFKWQAQAARNSNTGINSAGMRTEKDPKTPSSILSRFSKRLLNPPQRSEIKDEEAPSTTTEGVSLTNYNGQNNHSKRNDKIKLEYLEWNRSMNGI